MVRIVGNDTGASADGGFLQLRRHDDAGSPASSKQGKVFWMAEKAQVAWVGGFKRSKPLDQCFRVTVELGAFRIGKRLNNVGKSKRHTAPAMVQKVERFCEVSGSSTCGVESLDHLVGDVMLRIDVNRFLKNQIVLFGLSQRLHNLVGALDDLLQFFVLAGV